MDREARSRSLIAALTWLLAGLVGGLIPGVGFGLVVGLVVALRNGGWFVLLQKVAHRRLARAGNLPPRLYDFLEWGIDSQVFRRVGGGVRFHHNLIQQHLAKSHLIVPREAEARSDTRGAVGEVAESKWLIALSARPLEKSAPSSTDASVHRLPD